MDFRLEIERMGEGGHIYRPQVKMNFLGIPVWRYFDPTYYDMAESSLWKKTTCLKIGAVYRTKTEDAEKCIGKFLQTIVVGKGCEYKYRVVSASGDVEYI